MSHPLQRTAQNMTGTTGTTGTVVEFARVQKRFGAHLALTEFDLTLRAGELVALLGPSGSGKTTALRVLAGLERVDAGSILVNGEDVAGVATSRRDMGMVFQSYSLFPHLSAIENVGFGLRMRRVPAAARRERAAAALDMVGLGAQAGRFAHQLSGGQQQRVALARALVTRPRVLLLDEPLSALDAKVRVQLREQIRWIQTDLGITTLFVTHDQDEALAVADRVAVMRDGRIEQVGTPEELYTRPATTFIADFVGLSNRLPGVVRHGFAEVHGATLPLLDPSQADGPVNVFVRPEELTLADAARPGDGAPGTVLLSSFLGSLRRTSVLLDGGDTVVVQHDVREHPRPGESVRVCFSGGPVAVETVEPGRTEEPAAAGSEDALVRPTQS